MPYEINEEFIVDVTYQDGSQLQARNDKLMDAVKEAEGMTAFGLTVDTRRILRKTKQTVKLDNSYRRVYELI
jgi:hypothetical protein